LATEAQHMPMQQALVAEDGGLTPQAQRVPPAQQVLVVEDRTLAEQDEAQSVPTMQQDLVAEDSPLAGKVQHIQPIQQALVAEDSVLTPEVQRVHPTQQVLVAEDGVLAVHGEVQRVHPTQQDLVAEDLVAKEVQHVHPTQPDLVAEDLAAEEVQHVPHCNKHGMVFSPEEFVFTKETVGDAAFEITTKGIKTTDKYEPDKDWAASQEHRERTMDNQRWSHRTKDHDDLEVGAAVAIQNQTGPNPTEWNNTGNVPENKPNSKVMIEVDRSRHITMRNRRFVRPKDTTLRTTTRPAPVRREPATQPTTRQELPRRTPLSSPQVDADNVDETQAEVCEEDRDVRFEKVYNTEDVPHEVDV
jgi:hypothetical protein